MSSATKSPYLIATTSLGYLQGCEIVGLSVKVTRLPGIHHDGNVVILSGTLGHILVDAGTSWYQALQLERIKGQIGEQSLDRILLTSRRFPVSGGAKFLSQSFGNVPIHIHEDGQAALETGDFFTTWANRFDSDMPATTTTTVVNKEVFALGDGEIQALSMPGHCSDGMAYLIGHQKTLIAGTLLPRADRPTRWDLPSGSLLDLISSFEAILRMQLNSIVPLQGPAIRGKAHVKDVLERHLHFFKQAAEQDGRTPVSWHRPAPTALWHTPSSPWPLEEQETV